jgi:uncharacterized repeat protein (TIGR01451 family)
MRKLIVTVKQRITLQATSLVVSLLLSIVSISSVVLAYGPERPTFTNANPATYVTFNSISDDGSLGDERNFFRVRELTNGSNFKKDVDLVAGKQYQAMIFYHNNASSSFNASGVGIAHGAYARAEMPAVVKAGATNTSAEAFVGAANARPATVYDYIEFQNHSATDMSLRYIPGSTVINSKGAINGKNLGDTALFSSTGTLLGFDSLNGDLPGCDHYSGWITFNFTAVQPNFTFKKEVRQSGTKGWQDKVTVNPGTQVDYILTYTNTGTVDQEGVKLKDILPAGLTYVAGQAKLTNGNNPGGKTLADGINAGGVDVGNYQPGAVAYLTFSAKVDAPPCTVLKNTASAETDNGNLQSTATVTVAGNCAAALPTTGPAEVIAGLVGIGAITVGVVYFMRSRQDLEYALLHTQSHPIHSKIDLSAPDTTKVEDVEAEHKHKKSEHK